MKFLKAWIERAARRLTRNRRRRKELDGWAKLYGFKGGRTAAACAIARRCAGVEAALKRLAQVEERAALNAGPPGLTQAEIERLAMLAEACGEVVMAVGKVLRHGWQGRSPHGVKNRELLEREIGDVRAVAGLMLDAHDVELSGVQTWQRNKRAAMRKWTHHQKW